MYGFRLLALFCIANLASPAYARVDTVYTGHQQLAKNVDQEYNYRVIETALKLTEPEFGDYKIIVQGDGDIPKQRALEQLLKINGAFNVVLVPTQPEWEEKAIPIPIPVRMGLLNYRFLLTHKDKLATFGTIHTLETLLPLRVGLRKSWATWEVMQQQGFNVVNAYSYDTLFSMLDMNRFDYIPRGIYEIYDELKSRRLDYPNLVIEPNLVLVLPTPYYAFVSPHAPRIAERLTAGLTMMMEQGILRNMLYQHYGEALEQANIGVRRVIHIKNTTLSEETPLDKKHYWIDLFNASLTP